MWDLTDDLTADQFQRLLHWLWVNGFSVTRANVKGWRKQNNLPVDNAKFPLLART